MKVGDQYVLKKRFSLDEVRRFSEISKDENPIHFDAGYAKNTIFLEPIVQGTFVTSLFGGIIGSYLPGPGSIYISQTTKFVRPIHLDSEVHVVVAIVQIREDKSIYILRTMVEDDQGTLFVDGEAVIKYIG